MASVFSRGKKFKKIAKKTKTPNIILPKNVSSGGRTLTAAEIQRIKPKLVGPFYRHPPHDKNEALKGRELTSKERESIKDRSREWARKELLRETHPKHDRLSSGSTEANRYKSRAQAMQERQEKYIRSGRYDAEHIMKREAWEQYFKKALKALKRVRR